MIKQKKPIFFSSSFQTFLLNRNKKNKLPLHIKLSPAKFRKEIKSRRLRHKRRVSAAGIRQRLQHLKKIAKKNKIKTPIFKIYKKKLKKMSLQNRSKIIMARNRFLIKRKRVMLMSIRNLKNNFYYHYCCWNN